MHLIGLFRSKKFHKHWLLAFETNKFALNCTFFGFLPNLTFVILSPRVFIKFCVNQVSDGSGAQNSGFMFRKISMEYNGLNSLVEQGFSSFSPKSLPYLMIFQNLAVPPLCPTLKNYQIWKKFDKKWRKTWFNLP